MPEKIPAIQYGDLSSKYIDRLHAELTDDQKFMLDIVLIETKSEAYCIGVKRGVEIYGEVMNELKN